MKTNVARILDLLDGQENVDQVVAVSTALAVMMQCSAGLPTDWKQVFHISKAAVGAAKERANEFVTELAERN
jgi:hypothetical protein